MLGIPVTLRRILHSFAALRAIHGFIGKIRIRTALLFAVFRSLNETSVRTSARDQCDKVHKCSIWPDAVVPAHKWPAECFPSICALAAALMLWMPVPVTADTDGHASRNFPTTGLALGSGGAGGLSHIAILRVYDELGTRPARIAGTSVGAVIGALYAAGLTANEIEAIFKAFAGSELDVLSGILESDLGISDLFRSGLENGGLVDPSGFLEFLAGHMEATRFRDLEIPLTLVATDFWSGEPVILEHGNLLEAIHASIAVPGLFEPVRRGEQLLVDGGTSKPLPFDLLLGHVEKTIAIDVTGNRVPNGTNDGALSLLFKTFELMQQSITREMRHHREPDLYIRVDTSGIRLLEIHRLEEILRQAEPAARQLRETLLHWQDE